MARSVQAPPVERLARQLVLIAAAQQQAESALALPAIARPVRKAPANESAGPVELALPRWVAVGHGCGGELTVHAPLDQLAPDPLRAPLLERALVLGEQVGVAFIVEVAEGQQLIQRTLNRRRFEVPREQVLPNLADGSLTT